MSDGFLSFFPPDSGDFIKTIEDGIEYYCDRLTGRSGMSHIGLARFIGKSQPSITYWVRKIGASDPINSDLPECLKPFASKTFKLINRTDPEGSEILPDDFCAAMIAYYACFASPKDQTQEAKLALMVCTGIGLRTHIQGKTGWKPQPQKTDAIKELELRVRLAELEVEKLKILQAPATSPVPVSYPQQTPLKVVRKPKKPVKPGNEAKAKVLEVFEPDQYYTAYQISERAEVSDGYARRVLVALWREQKVGRKRTSGQQTPWMYWKIEQP